jgi:hypothetical protein
VLLLLLLLLCMGSGSSGTSMRGRKELAVEIAQNRAGGVHGRAHDAQACEAAAAGAASIARAAGGGGGRGGRGGPDLEAFLVLLEGGRGQDLLGEDPGVAAYGEEITERGVLQGKVGVSDGAGGVEGADALFGVEVVVGVGWAMVLMVLMVVVAGEGG